MTARLQVLLLLLLVASANAFYVSYEKPRSYSQNERIPLVFNKLVSPATLSSMDYDNLPFCNVPADPVASSNIWQTAVQALHGDQFYHDNTFTYKMLDNKYCQQLCIVDMDDSNGNNKIAMDYNNAIASNYRHQPYFDGMPVALRLENDEMISTKYWGGIPLGQRGGNDAVNFQYDNTTTDDLFVYNHWSWTIFVHKTTAADDTYQIVRAQVQPYSIQHIQTSSSVRSVCNITSRQTFYEEWQRVPPQPAQGKVLFTYDTHYVVVNDQESSGQSTYKTRWDVFLTMDYAIQPIVQISAVVFGLVINGILISVLYIWVNRDLSYKPIMMHVEEYDDDDDDDTDQQPKQNGNGSANFDQEEIKLWPLSTRLFFAPVWPVTFAILNGIGAHLFVFGSFYLFFFQLGIINLSSGAHVITPAVIMYTVSSVVGGYVTGRFLSILYQTDRKTMLYASIITACAYPVLGIVTTVLVYDVIPGANAPSYNVIASAWPVLLVWLFTSIPLTIFGSMYGHKGGPIDHFPVSEGSGGYHDLNLQSVQDNDDSQISKCFNVARLPILFTFCGFLPVLCCFISYSYGIGGPVLQGQYTSSNLNIFAPYLLFCLCAGLIACLLLYRQTRNQLYAWWWAAFYAAGSAGFWILVLSLSWLFFNVRVGGVGGAAFCVYFMWFVYIAMGTVCMTGFVGVASCIVFTRALYVDALRRCG